MGLLSLLADVLFVGQSLFGPPMPDLLESALKLQDSPSHVEAQVLEGANLGQAWDSSAAAAGVDARARLAARPADVLILGDAQPIATADGASAEAAARFGALALQTNPATRIFILESWTAPGSDAAAWRQELDGDLPDWERLVRDTAARLGHPVTLIPAAGAFGQLADAIAAGQVPDARDIGDFLAPDGAPTAKGLYFLTLLQAAKISGKSPIGLPAKLTRSWASRDAVISDVLAARLQEIAWSAILGYVPGAAPPDETPLALATAENATVASVPDAPFPDFAPITNPNLSLNLSGIADWAVNQPFLDVMKTARPWIGHKPGQWGGWEQADLEKAGALGPNGWPVRIPPEITSIATLILTDLPEDAGGVAGRYLLTYEGNGTLQISGRAEVAEASPGRILFDYTPGEGAVILTISAIDPDDPIRNIVVVRAARAGMLAKGAIFNPDWLSRLRGVRAIRLMNWMETNDSTVSSLADRPKPGDYTYARKGVPMEVLIALANELHANPWFCMPHLADDDLVRGLAQMVHDGLDRELIASVEYSNEVWNWQFAQARWAEAQGKARWGQDQTWVQFYGLRAAEVADIWAGVFKDAPNRLVRVIATQTGWLGLESQILDAPLVVAEGRRAPVDSFDAYAVTGYFSGLLVVPEKAEALTSWLQRSDQAAQEQIKAEGLTGSAAADYLATHRYDLADQLAAQEIRDGSVTGEASGSIATLLSETLPYHASLAADRGLKLVMYEGGSHVVGIGPLVDDPAITAFLMHFNYTPEMAALYAAVMEGWRGLSDQPFNGFVDIYRPGKWGSWGALRHLGDDNPRWQVLAKGCLQC